MTSGYKWWFFLLQVVPVAVLVVVVVILIVIAFMIVVIFLFIILSLCVVSVFIMLKVVLFMISVVNGAIADGWGSGSGSRGGGGLLVILECTHSHIAHAPPGITFHPTRCRKLSISSVVIRCIVACGLPKNVHRIKLYK